MSPDFPLSTRTMAKVGKPKPTNVVIQGMQLQKAFPDSSCQFGHGSLVWEGTIQPTSVSESYRVRLEYRHGKLPKVRLIDPEIECRDGSRPEHLYPDGSLCVFFPRHREWNHSMPLAKTIVPWVSEWLLHYEVWLATGEWRGGAFTQRKRRSRTLADASTHRSPGPSQTSVSRGCTARRPEMSPTVVRSFSPRGTSRPISRYDAECRVLVRRKQRSLRLSSSL